MIIEGDPQLPASVSRYEINTPLSTSHANEGRPSTKTSCGSLTLEVVVHLLLCSLPTREPGHATLAKLLNTRLQLGLVELIIVDRSDSWDAHPGETAADSVHQRATDGTEIVGHCISGGNSLVLSEFAEFVLATDMLHAFVLDDEVRCEHLDTLLVRFIPMKTKVFIIDHLLRP